MKICLLATAALIALAACAPAENSAPASDLKAHGAYLVNNIGGCNDCHTPMTPEGPDMTRALQGAVLMFEPTIEMPWAPIAPSIAGIPAHYTQEEFISFLQTGLRPDGLHPLPPMPEYRFNEKDARAIAAYIKTVPTAQP